MHPVIPQELTQNAVQMVVYCITTVGILLGVLVGSRA
jgi:hypothetical protein